MNASGVRRFRYYASRAADLSLRREEPVYVAGFRNVNGDRWCMVSDRKGVRARLLTHPSMLRPLVQAVCGCCGEPESYGCEPNCNGYEPVHPVEGCCGRSGGHADDCRMVQELP